MFPPSAAAFAQVVVTEAAASGDVPSSAVLYVGYAALGVADAYENTPPDDIAWTDVSSRNYTHESVTVSRGIQYEQQSLEAGTMAVTLASNDAAWTFGNTESAYWPNAGDTDVPVRLRAVWPGSITPYYPLFSGYTDDIGFGWDEDWYGYARVEAADCWSRLTQQLLGCAEQEVLLEPDLAGYWTCSLAGTNTAPGGTSPVATADSPLGAGPGVAVFTSTAITLAGDPGVSCWQSTGLGSGDADVGVALAYQPGAGTPAIPPVAGGVTIEFWFQPVSVSASQPTGDLTVCTCWGSRGPLWTLYIDNLAGAGSSSIYVVTYDKATGAGTSTKLGTSTYLGAALGYHHQLLRGHVHADNLGHRAQLRRVGRRLLHRQRHRESRRRVHRVLLGRERRHGRGERRQPGRQLRVHEPGRLRDSPV